MLYVVQNGFNGVYVQNPQDIVYCVTDISKIIEAKLSFIFTDGHAINKLSRFFTNEDIYDLEKILDFESIKKTYWNNESDLDIKRRKEAEFLVGQDIPISIVSGWVVYNQTAKNVLSNLGVSQVKIAIRENYYF